MVHWRVPSASVPQLGIQHVASTEPALRSVPSLAGSGTACADGGRGYGRGHIHNLDVLHIEPSEASSALEELA